MLIRYSRPRVRPPGNVVLRVRKGHPLADGLVLCFVAGGGHGVGRDLVTGALFASNNSAGTGLAPDGPGLDVSGTAYASAEKVDTWNVTGPVSLGWRGVIRTPTVLGNLISNIPTGGNGGSNTPFSLEYNNGASAGLNFTRANGGGFRGWISAASVLIADRPQTASVSQSGTIESAPAFWIDGASSAATNPGGASTGAAAANANPLWIGRRQDGAEQTNGITNLILVSATEWATGQHQRFNDDPYAVLEEAPLWHFFGPASSATVVSLTGSSATVSAGTLTPAMSLSASGSSATSAAGTLTSALAASVSGSAGTGALGTVTSGIGMALSGEALTVSAGSLDYTIGFTLTGVSSATAGGTLSTGGGDTTAERALTGISMSALPGNVRVTGGTRWVPQEARAVAVATSAGNTMPPPPRLTGDAQTDIRAQQQYLQTFYDQFVKVNNVLGRINDHETRIAALEGDT